MITEQIIITVITASASIVAAMIANIAAMSRTSRRIDTQIALIEQKIDQLSVREINKWDSWMESKIIGSARILRERQKKRES